MQARSPFTFQEINFIVLSILFLRQGSAADFFLYTLTQCGLFCCIVVISV